LELRPTMGFISAEVMPHSGGIVRAYRHRRVVERRQQIGPDIIDFCGGLPKGFRNISDMPAVKLLESLLDSLRWQDLTLHNAFSWKGQHLFLTAILPQGRGHLDISAALVQLETIRLVPVSGDQGMTFPGVLTEKYLAHRQEWPMSVNDLELVLVVPKIIQLQPGRLVECLGASWEVLVPRELDEFKNEYEIGRRAEL